MFLLADFNIEVVLGMPFLTLSNANIQFAKKKLTWRSYTIAKALPTTERVEIINRKEFTKAALDENVEAFVVHVTSLSLNLMPIQLARGAQIALLVIKEMQIPALDKNVEAFMMHVTSLSFNLMPIHPAQGTQIASLVIKEVQIPALDKNVEAFMMHVTFLSLNLILIHPAREAQIALLVIEKVQILSEYLDFSDIFSKKRASILLKATDLNQHAIKLQENQPW